VTPKNTEAVAAVLLDKQDCKYLGNLNAPRDCGHACDYAEGMRLILQQPRAEKSEGHASKKGRVRSNTKENNQIRPSSTAECRPPAVHQIWATKHFLYRATIHISLRLTRGIPVYSKSTLIFLVAVFTKCAG
jgi:hypothetical protein